MPKDIFDMVEEGPARLEGIDSDASYSSKVCLGLKKSFVSSYMGPKN